jgi:hypothetical protein
MRVVAARIFPALNIRVLRSFAFCECSLGTALRLRVPRTSSACAGVFAHHNFPSVTDEDEVWQHTRALPWGFKLITDGTAPEMQ